ncbi:MAG: MopE-related protein [bacterium]
MTCQGNICVPVVVDPDAAVDAAIPPGRISVFPDPVQFGFAPLHIDTVREVTIANVGSGPLTVTEITVNENDLLDEYTAQPSGPVSIILQPTETTTVQVVLHPEDGELDFGTLDVRSDDPNNVLVSVQLQADYKGDPTLEMCVLDDDVVDPEPFVDCNVDQVNSEPLIDYGVVPFGIPAVAVVAIRNGADGNAPLRIDDVQIQSSIPAIQADMSLRLFQYDTGGASEIPVVLPMWLSAGDPLLSLDPELIYAEVTFGANVDGVISSTWLVVISSDPNGRDVPISGMVSGCPAGWVDLNQNPVDGCEYECTYTGPEICQSGNDDNCDGNQDEPDALGCTTYYRDVDMDGYGVTADATCLCEPNAAESYTATAMGDCNDLNNSVNPAGTEVCNGMDDDCNNLVDDGLGQTTCGLGLCLHTVDNCVGGVPQVCDAMLGAVPESCDGLDNDCDGSVDEDLGTTTCGLGECAHTVDNCVGGSIQFCNPFQGAGPEICDGLDNNCNGAADADPAGEVDNDGDGVLSCNDCDDNDPNNFPGNPEVCDGQDNNCNGVADFPGFEVDNDGDGSLSCADCNDNNPNNFPGNPEVCDGQDNDCNGLADFPGELVDADGGGVRSCADCNDNDPTNFPGNPEVCDGKDNNCNGAADYPGETTDADGDGVLACADCNDNDPTNFPGNPEVCDGRDNNCNGVADFPGELTDSDGDGVPSCADCNDANPNNFPGNPEVCDGQDNDCNGVADFPGELTDADGDGVRTCADCNDNDPNNGAGNPEICDGLDNDCNGLADFPGETTDADGDGVPACADCNDSDPNNFPGNPEICDGQDNDCNGFADAPGGEIDTDGDGVLSCADCNDADPNNFPGNPEICDGQDNDCDGLVDQADVPVSAMCGDVPNATEACNGAAGCGIAACVTNFYDVDGAYLNGCECQASPTPATSGATCGTAINLGTFTDNPASQVDVIGNTPFAGREIWYRFAATDDNDTIGDEYHVDVRFLTNPGNLYVMDVWEGGCPATGTQMANTENCCFDWYTDFNRTSTGCTISAPCGEGNCRATNQSGYNICNNDSKTFYVRIRHTAGQPMCTEYDLRVSNGVY